MKIGDNNSKLKLEYPCQWIYKVIGNNYETIQKALAQNIKEKNYKISHSNNSKNGKYCCLNLEIVVKSEKERNSIYRVLDDDQNIVMVL